MQKIKEKIVKEIELKEIQMFQKLKDKLKEKIIANNKLKITNDCPIQVSKAIESIRNKMSQCKFVDLHPPYFPKTITKYRHEYFLPIKKEYHNKLNTQNIEEFKKYIKPLSSFVSYMDCQYIDIYLEQIRQPYVRKIFNQNYQFDKIDFKQLNSQYKIRSQIQNLLNNASQWLLQIELTQDLFDRIQLYLDIRTPMLIEKAKKQGIQAKKQQSWSEYLSSITRKITSYSLRKSSKVIQSTFFTAVAPAAAVLTFAIIGGSATLPWPSDINGKLLLTPVLAVAVPYLLDNLAESVERKQFMSMLQQWAISLSQIANNIAKFNEQTQETLLACCLAQNPRDFAKQKLNLQKITHTVSNNIQNMTNFSSEKFQDLRDRTQEYFRKYIEVKEGQWTIVIPSQEDYNK